MLCNMLAAKRMYKAVELTFEQGLGQALELVRFVRAVPQQGNAEGYVKSDIGQDDAGISQDFDYLA